jgi:hypothetical protein
VSIARADSTLFVASFELTLSREKVIVIRRPHTVCVQAGGYSHPHASSSYETHSAFSSIVSAFPTFPSHTAAAAAAVGVQAAAAAVRGTYRRPAHRRRRRPTARSLTPRQTNARLRSFVLRLVGFFTSLTTTASRSCTGRGGVVAVVIGRNVVDSRDRFGCVVDDCDDGAIIESAGAAGVAVARQSVGRMERS